jgi:hypothetical protein
MGAEPSFNPDRVVASLNAADVDYVIVGGLAVGAHGVVRATRDIDIVPAPEQSHMDRLADCLHELGGEHPIDGRLTGAAPSRTCDATGSRSRSRPTRSPRSAPSLTSVR